MQDYKTFRNIGSNVTKPSINQNKNKLTKGPVDEKRLRAGKMCNKSSGLGLRRNLSWLRKLQPSVFSSLIAN